VPVQVRVVTAEREIWSGEAQMVIARGTEGEVGILGGHAPLLIRLAIGPLRILRDGEEARTVVDGGFMHVTSEGDQTRVDVLARQAELASEIDVDAARSRKEAAEARLAEDPEDSAARSELAGASARIDLLGS
jgi:F-type H+-transporting ATPase subunit epsilon